MAHGADDFMACVAEGEISLEPPVFDADRLELVTLSEGTHSSLSMGADGVLRGTKYDLGDSDRKSTSLEVREIEPLINAFLRQLGEMSFREVSTWLRENGVEHLVSTENFD